MLLISLAALCLSVAPMEERIEVPNGGFELIRAANGKILVDAANSQTDLTRGDELVEFEGKELIQVWAAINGSVGHPITIQVLRGGQRMPITFTVEVDPNGQYRPMKISDRLQGKDREAREAMNKMAAESFVRLQKQRAALGPPVSRDKLELDGSTALTARVSADGQLLDGSVWITPLWVYGALRFNAFCDGESRRSLEVTGPQGKTEFDLTHTVSWPSVDLALWSTKEVGATCKTGNTLTQPVEVRLVCASGKELIRDLPVILTLECGASGVRKWLNAEPSVSPSTAVEGRPVELLVHLATEQIKPTPKRIELVLLDPGNKVLQTAGFTSGIDEQVEARLKVTLAPGIHRVVARVKYADGSENTSAPAQLEVKTAAVAAVEEKDGRERSHKVGVFFDQLKDHYTCDEAMKAWVEAQPNVTDVNVQANRDMSLQVAGRTVLLQCHHH